MYEQTLYVYDEFCIHDILNDKINNTVNTNHQHVMPICLVSRPVSVECPYLTTALYGFCGYHEAGLCYTSINCLYCLRVSLNVLNAL